MIKAIVRLGGKGGPLAEANFDKKDVTYIVGSATGCIVSFSNGTKITTLEPLHVIRARLESEKAYATYFDNELLKLIDKGGKFEEITRTEEDVEGNAIVIPILRFDKDADGEKVDEDKANQILIDAYNKYYNDNCEYHYTELFAATMLFDELVIHSDR